jgi:hypothetical protein
VRLCARAVGRALSARTGRVVERLEAMRQGLEQTFCRGAPGARSSGGGNRTAATTSGLPMFDAGAGVAKLELRPPRVVRLLGRGVLRGWARSRFTVNRINRCQKCSGTSGGACASGWARC